MSPADLLITYRFRPLASGAIAHVFDHEGLLVAGPLRTDDQVGGELVVQLPPGRYIAATNDGGKPVNQFDQYKVRGVEQP